MRRSFTRFLIAAPLVLSLGLHWTLLQSAAWVGMIVSYSHTSSLAEAVAKTFDGDHPCPLCKVVQNGTSQDKKKELQTSTKKLPEFTLASTVSLTPPGRSAPLPAGTDRSFDRRTERPAIPPPRAV